MALASWAEGHAVSHTPYFLSHHLTTIQYHIVTQQHPKTNIQYCVVCIGGWHASSWRARCCLCTYNMLHMTYASCYLNHDVPMLTIYPHHRQYTWLLCYMFSPHITLTECMYMLSTEIGLPRVTVSHRFLTVTIFVPLRWWEWSLSSLTRDMGLPKCVAHATLVQIWSVRLIWTLWWASKRLFPFRAGNVTCYHLSMCVECEWRFMSRHVACTCCSWCLEFAITNWSEPWGWQTRICRTLFSV